MQLSVSLKFPVEVIEVTTSAMPPVLESVTAWGLLDVPTGSDANVNEAGCVDAVVSCVPADHKGICQIPRPYVPATRTLGEVVAGAALNCTTGANGRPAPKTDQQLDGPLVQVATWRVE